MSELSSKPPFFVLGAQRSGTTMLRLMLNNHSRLAIPHETAFITIYFPRLADYGDLSKRENAVRLAYSERAGEVVPAESLKWHRNSIRPPDPAKLGQWKVRLPRSERIIFEQVAGSALDMFGYPRENLAPTLASRARGLYYGLIKRY